MNKDLIDFHLSCKDEYNFLLNEFNLLFFGYGNKENVLSELFPEALQFNLRFYSLNEIISEICENNNLKAISFEEIDKKLHKKKLSLILILYNFNFSIFNNLHKFKNLKVIGTIENLNFDFTTADMHRNNFIFRDITTFEDYAEDIAYSEILENKTENLKTILSNLTEKSKLIFKELLQIGNCNLNTLFNKVKKELFLSKTTSLIELIREFTDHKVLKISGNDITINLNKTEIAEILAYLKSSSDQPTETS
jgi:hypothetical protein